MVKCVFRLVANMLVVLKKIKKLHVLKLLCHYVIKNNVLR